MILFINVMAIRKDLKKIDRDLVDEYGKTIRTIKISWDSIPRRFFM